MPTNKEKTNKPGLIAKVKHWADFAWNGVWDVPSKTLGIKILKTLNLSVRTFMDSDIQDRASALTYTTVLSIVPLFALLLAIGRGFGLQDLLQTQLYAYFPAQGEAIQMALNFVDSYLKQASQGVFVGIGILFLLWTLISLLSSIEKSFNHIWGITQNRSSFRKLTDYIAIMVMIPILIICASGISIFMTNAIQRFLDIKILSAWLSWGLDLSPFILICIAFTLTFLLIPNTKVKFKYALISGIICGIAFQFLEDLFVSGQIYVSKYNAIYGSFAFLPLLLIWLQLSWMIVLFGCVLTYSSQNIFRFNFTDNIADISIRTRQYLCTIVMAACIQRFSHGEKPMSIEDISRMYSLPIRLVTITVQRLRKAGLIYDVVISKESKGIVPAVESQTYTLGELLSTMSDIGENIHMPYFATKYAALIEKMAPVLDNAYTEETILLKDIPLPQLDSTDVSTEK